MAPSTRPRVRLLLFGLLTRAVFGQPYYTPADDASWAIMSTDLSSILGEDKQSLYDQFIADCNEAAWSQDKGDNVCTEDEEWRMKMNIEQPPNVYNYTTVGYQKIKAPRELFDLIDEFYQKNKDKAAIEYNQVNSFHNMWDSPPTILPIQREEFGGSSELKNKILNAAKPIMEEWTGQELMAVSLFGIRTYHRGSILTPHVDRLPLVVSAIINVDQDVDEAWSLEVYGHDGKATNITMLPGEMILYESHSVIHGRPFPLEGDFYANIFAHFEPLGPLDQNGESNNDISGEMPPYLIPNTSWEEQWKQQNPDGWKAKMSGRTAAIAGDIPTLMRLGDLHPESLHEPDRLGWRPLHEAARLGQVEVVRVLLSHGADVNDQTKTGVSPLNIAREFLGEDHKMTRFLLENGAIDVSPEL